MSSEPEKETFGSENDQHLEEPEHQPEDPEQIEEENSEQTLVIDTEPPASPIATSSSLNSTVICTNDGSLYLVDDENAPLPRLPSGSVVLGVDDPWPRIQYLYRSTSIDEPIIVYKSLDAERVSNSKSLEKPSPSDVNDSNDEKRLLICFLCNLSFSSTLNFLCHVKEPFHDVHLSTDERQLIVFEKNSSAIVQNCFDNSSSSTSTYKCIVCILMKDEEKTLQCNSTNDSASQALASVAGGYANLDLLDSSSNSAPSTAPTSAYCNLHPEGKSLGVECPKCDLILGSSRSLGGHMTMMHSRNSCKTLKCPKCNWHYKYQETLEIHMKEKHSDVPTTCPYCVANTPHPRLGRGEQWSCGYKPFRCDVCKYSTTTKGNLAIHMQSDKHLNNVQEIQQSDFMTDSINAASHSASASASLLSSSNVTNSLQNFNSIVSSSSSSASTTTSATTMTMNKIKPVLRCDVCNYETNVARNLRIHMTSEKHTSNVILLQQSVKQYQRQSFTIPSASDLHFHANMCQASYARPSSAATNLSVSGDDFNSNTSIALTLQNTYLQRALVDGKLYQCCICMNFVCDTVEELVDHCQNVDRSRPNDGDVSVMSGNYLCNLCNYKTHLKANFQLHTKTDKHLQRLQLVNHIREGGGENELRMKYLNLNNPIQLRCVACNEFANSFHKIQMHAATMRHKSFVESFRKISRYATKSSSSNLKLYCALCGFVADSKQLVYAHLHSEQHNELANQFLPMMEASGNVTCWIEIRDDLQNDDSDCGEGFESDVDDEEEDEDAEELEEEQRCCNNENDTVDAASSSIMSDAVHCCSECSFTTSDVREFCKHNCCLKNDENCRSDDEEENMQNQKYLCPLCQTDCGLSKERLECHLTQIHNVSNEVVKSLMNLLPSMTNSSDLTNSYDNNETSSSGVGGGEESSKKHSCPLCSVPFDNLDDLYSHQSDVGHMEMKPTPDGPSYLCCWKGCNQYFKTLQIVQNHFREIHGGKKLSASTTTRNTSTSASPTPSSACVTSDRHAYRFRCTQCSLAFISEDKLRAHQQYHVIRAATKCAICGRTFRSTAALKKHVETTHINLNAAELLQYKAQLMSNDDIDDVPSTTGRSHQHQTDDTVAASASSRASSDINSISSVEDKLEEHLNCVDIALSMYSDANRKFKCHRCKMSFTKQTFLSIHNRTLQHRRGDKSSNYNIERYHDPSRPFKCEICKESFTQKSILLVHLNSVLHLHKMKKAHGNNNSTTTTSSNDKSTTSNNNNKASSIVSPSSQHHSSVHKNIKQEQQTNEMKQFHLPMSSFNPSLENSFSSLFQSMKANNFQNGDNFELGSSNTEMNAKQMVNDMLTKKQQNNTKSSSNKSNTSSFLPSSMTQMQQQSAAALLQMASLAPFFDSMLPSQTAQKLNEDFLKMTNGDHGLAVGQHEKYENGESPQTPSNFEQSVQKSSRAQFTKHGRGTTFKRLLEDYGFEMVMQYNESSSRHLKRSKSMDEHVINNENDVPLSKKPKMEVENLPKTDKPNGPTTSLQVPELKKCHCACCGKSFSSVWVLKAHMEHVHREIIPLGEVEKVSEEFKQAYEKKHPAAVAQDEVAQQVPQVTPTPVAHADNPKPKPSQQQQQIQNQQQQSLNMMNLAAMAQTPMTSQAQAAAVAAMSLSMGLGMQFPFMGMPFGPYGQNPFLPMMVPPNFDSLFSHPPVSSASSNASAASKQFQQAMNTMNQQAMNSMNQQALNSMNNATMVIQQQQKRARTRITDEQLKVLREYFDINNSPTEEQIEQMAMKSGLPQKVIKHWFRNTLFKERQRSKDSPYNFNIPPSLGIDLEEYEKTGETKVIPYDLNNSDWPAASSSTSIVINCGEPSAESVTDNEDEPSKLVVKVEADDIENKSEQHLTLNNSSLYSIKEERPDSVDESITSQDEQQLMDDFSRDRTPSFGDSSNFLAMSAQETLRRLTSALPNLPIPFGAGSSNFFNQKTPSSAQDLTSMIANALSPSAQLTAAGRRANRTRFTEWQVKMLQEFFDKNAYPKDDDLESLSKKLNLSPRVIVVWFQNARQKARKVYENLPPENDDRFLRTPGLNYQCKKCNLVFQRYYELIKHQKSLCFKEENAAGVNGGEFVKKIYTSHSPVYKSESNINSLSSHNSKGSDKQAAKNNKSTDFKCETCNIYFSGPIQFDEHLKVHACNPMLFNDASSQVSSALSSSPVDVQQRQSLIDMMKSGSSSGEVSPDTANTKRQRTQILPEQLEVLYEKYKKDSRPSVKVLDEISQDTGLSKRVVQVWFQNTRMRERRGQINHDVKPTLNNNGGSKFFNKRCPFCGILFHSKITMESHLASKHPSQYTILEVNIDSLPDAEEVPTITTVPMTEALWNALGSSTDSTGITQSMLSLGVPTMVPGTTTVASNYGQKLDLTNIIDRVATGKVGTEETPLDLSRSIKQEKVIPLSADELRAIRTPSTSCYSYEDEISFNSTEDDDMMSNCSQDSRSPHQQVLAALARPQKRFRTHLTLQQVKVMKYLFHDFKTPSMSECEALGNEIGLYKRVVQVWYAFQNARAKERKVKMVGSNGGDVSPDVKPTPLKCILCNVPYTGRISMQDHSFSKAHIDKIRQTVEDPHDIGGQVVIDVNDESYSSLTPSNGQSSSRTTNNDHHSSSYTTSSASSRETAATGTSSSKVSANSQKHSQSPQPSQKKMPNTQDTMAAMAVAQNLLPYVYSAGNPAAAYYASMMMPAGFSGLSNGGLFYDPNLHGTPVNLLQIPPNIMQVITNSMQRGKDASCRFTQDGKTVADLAKNIEAKEKCYVSEKDVEVGWACRRCVSVFQAEQLFTNHQRMICQSSESPFLLIQTHYECNLCNKWFGTQVEYKKHCELPEHSSKLTSMKRI